VKGDLEFSNLFSPAWQDFQERKNKISERTRSFKVCSKCGEIKPIFKFSVDRRNTDGRTNICKACKIIEYMNYYYQNRSEILVKIKKYRENNKRDRSKYFKDYQEKHKEHLKEKAKKWYLENKEMIKERNLKYYQDHEQACRVKRKLWGIKNREKIKKYNREYKQKHK